MEKGEYPIKKTPDISAWRIMNAVRSNKPKSNKGKHKGRIQELFNSLNKVKKHTSNKPAKKKRKNPQKKAHVGVEPQNMAGGKIKTKKRSRKKRIRYRHTKNKLHK